MKDNKSNIGVIAAYAAVCIIWGSTYLAMRIAVKQFPPELFAGIRFLSAGAIVLVFAIINRNPFPGSMIDVAKSAVPGLFMLMGANGLVIWAEQWVHSGITSLILATTPLFVALLETLLFRDRKIGASGWTYLLIGFAGTAMLIISGAGIGSIDISGGFIVLIAAILWSVGSIYSKKVKYSGHIITHIGIQMLAAGIGLTVIGLLIGEASKVYFSSNTLLAMIYLVIFGSIIGYSSNMFVLNKWPASVAITSAYVNPVVAVILGVLLLNEPVNPQMIVFVIITLGSVVLLHLTKFGVFTAIKKRLLSGKEPVNEVENC
jgi:drug/metabolite transporter (DMT)-like permease